MLPSLFDFLLFYLMLRHCLMLCMRAFFLIKHRSSALVLCFVIQLHSSIATFEVGLGYAFESAILNVEQDGLDCFHYTFHLNQGSVCIFHLLLLQLFVLIHVLFILHKHISD